ncbi:DUF6387 family protein [Niveibacterium microcysteis]|nr:DUF6387 family protein [Niveibacterium microcysteis]
MPPFKGDDEIDPIEYCRRRGFEPCRYDNCATWDLDAWRHALHRRRLASARLHRAMENEEKHKDDDKNTEWSKVAIANVIKEVESFFIDPAAQNSEAKRMEPSDSRERQGVRDRTVLDELISSDRVSSDAFSSWEELRVVWQNEDLDNPSAAIRAAAADTGIDLDRGLYDLDNRPLWQTEPLNGTPDFFVSVSLGKPDTELVRDFKAWLKHTRRESGFLAANAPISANLLEKWHDNSVLAYIDLSLYAKASCLRITNEKMAELLFHNRLESVSDTDKLRTTKKYAQVIMKDTYFSSMRHVA